jgi:hypothetical protein
MSWPWLALTCLASSHTAAGRAAALTNSSSITPACRVLPGGGVAGLALPLPRRSRVG